MVQEIEDKKLIDAGKIDELVEARVERVITDANNKYAALEQVAAADKSRADKAEGKLKGLLIDKDITSAVANVGSVRKGGMTDVLSRAKDVWTLDDEGNLVAKKGDNIIYGSDGKSPLSPQEWAQSLVTDAPFLFEGSKGAGANGGDNKKARWCHHN